MTIDLLHARLNLFLKLATSLSQPSPDQSAYLKDLEEEDQRTRKEWLERTNQAGGYSKELAAQYAKEKGTSLNDIFGERARLQQFIKYPFKFEKFTDSDWNNYWLVVQHCDFDPQFQAASLKIIQQYRGKDNEQYKYLYDRNLCGQKKPQIYGTQNPDYCQLDPKSPYLEEAKARIKTNYNKDL